MTHTKRETISVRHSVVSTLTSVALQWWAFSLCSFCLVVLSKEKGFGRNVNWNESPLPFKGQEGFGKRTKPFLYPLLCPETSFPLEAWFRTSWDLVFTTSIPMFLLSIFVVVNVIILGSWIPFRPYLWVGIMTSRFGYSCRVHVHPLKIFCVSFTQIGKHGIVKERNSYRDVLISPWKWLYSKWHGKDRLWKMRLISQHTQQNTLTDFVILKIMSASWHFAFQIIRITAVKHKMQNHCRVMSVHDLVRFPV